MKKSILLTALACATTLGVFAQSRNKTAPTATPSKVRSTDRNANRVAHPTGKGAGVIPYGAPAPAVAREKAAPAQARHTAPQRAISQKEGSKHVPMTR